jgi:hypothetical protein
LHGIVRPFGSDNTPCCRRTIASFRSGRTPQFSCFMVTCCLHFDTTNSDFAHIEHVSTSIFCPRVNIFSEFFVANVLD